MIIKDLEGYGRNLFQGIGSLEYGELHKMPE